jgi:hypothetical protein
LSKFEYDLAESIRKSVASIAIKNGLQIVHHKDRILEISVSYASYAYWEASEILKQHLSMSRLGEIWPHFIQRWGGLDFFAKNSVHLFPEDTMQTMFDITANFLKKSCKRCDYRCLRKFIRPDAMQMPVIAPNAGQLAPVEWAKNRGHLGE